MAASAITVAAGTTLIATQNSPQVSPAPSGLGVACGKERWDVKTLSDPAASSVNLTPMDTTVAALRTLPGDPTATTRLDVEKQVYQVSATVTAYKQEADGDYHLAVTDGAGNTMIFEIPDPACVNSPFRAQIAAARDAWLKAHPVGLSFVTGSWPVTVTGPALMDHPHGQRGLAPNAVEIHPVLTLEMP